MTSFGASTQAGYTDGRTARRYDVTVRVEADGLHISSDDGTIVETWPFPALRLVDDAYAGRPIRLMQHKGSERLTIGDAAFLDHLRPHSRKIRRRDYRKRNLFVRGASWVGAAVAILLGFWFLLPLAAEPVASVIPLSWEEGLGEAVQGQALAIMARGSKTCRGRQGQQAIEKLVRRLSAQSPSRYTFRVTVIDNKITNAFAAPGGYVVIFRGLIDNSPNADALAGVVAHEMGHVIERHGMEQLVKSIGLSIVIGAVFGDTSSIGGVAAGVAQRLASSKFSRDDENEADKVAVRMLNKANISGAGFQAFFAKLAKKSGEKADDPNRYFASHPPTAGRAAFVRNAAKGTGPAMTDAEWQAVKTMCQG